MDDEAPLTTLTLYEVYEDGGALLLVTSERGHAQAVADQNDMIHSRPWVATTARTTTWQPEPKRGLNG